MSISENDRTLETTPINPPSSQFLGVRETIKTLLVQRLACLPTAWHGTALREGAALAPFLFAKQHFCRHFTRDNIAQFILERGTLLTLPKRGATLREA